MQHFALVFLFFSFTGELGRIGIGSNATFLYNRMWLLHLTVNCLVRFFFVNMIHLFHKWRTHGKKLVPSHENEALNFPFVCSLRLSFWSFSRAKNPTRFPSWSTVPFCVQTGTQQQIFDFELILSSTILKLNEKNETNALFNEKYLQNSIKTHKFSQIACYTKVVYPKTPRFHD